MYTSSTAKAWRYGVIYTTGAYTLLTPLWLTTSSDRWTLAVYSMPSFSCQCKPWNTKSLSAIARWPLSALYTSHSCYSLTFYSEFQIMWLLFEGNVWSTADSMHDIMKGRRWGRRLMSQWRFFVRGGPNEVCNVFVEHFVTLLIEFVPHFVDLT